MAFTLADKAMIEEEPLKKGVIIGLVKTSFLMEKLPFETIGDLSVEVTRWKSLPDFGWRDINGTFTESTGKLEQLMEAVYILGGEIDVDTVLADAKRNIVDPRSLQTKMKTKSVAFN